MRTRRRTFPHRATENTTMTTEKRARSAGLWEKMPRRMKSSVDDSFNHIPMALLFTVILRIWTKKS